MANKFAQNLAKSNESIKEARAAMIAEDASAAQEQILLKLKQEKRDMERELMSLSDMYPDSELSLKVTKSEFNPQAWVKRVQDLKVSILNKSVEVKLAQDTYDEWFKEVGEVVIVKEKA